MRERRRAAAERAAEDAEHLAYTHATVESGLAVGSLTIDPLDVAPFIAMMAERTRHREAAGTIADRAAADRSWQFGHVIVDEAQELSPMEWRMLMRRCHRRSMTLVGDLAQAASDSGVQSWSDLLDQYAPGRWRTAELTVNYRTPAEIMAVAGDVLTAIDPTATPPVSARSTEVAPWGRSCRADLVPALLEAVADEQIATGDGRLAVIVPGSRYAELTDAVAAALPGVAHGSDPTLLDAGTVILTVDQSKGLEFDSVLIADPAAILRESARGGSDLYVAVTRATQRLGVIAIDVLPDVLRRLPSDPERRRSRVHGPESPRALGRRGHGRHCAEIWHHASVTIIAAADGSALGNPGPAGWGWYVDEDRWACGGWPHGTNNMGELTAVLDLLQQTAATDEDLLVYCDSTYAINSITKWMPGWKRKNWRKGDGKPVQNVEIMKALDAAMQGRRVRFEWVKGHAGHELNEQADRLANSASIAYSQGRAARPRARVRGGRGTRTCTPATCPRPSRSPRPTCSRCWTTTAERRGEGGRARARPADRRRPFRSGRPGRAAASGLDRDRSIGPAVDPRGDAGAVIAPLSEPVDAGHRRGQPGRRDHHPAALAGGDRSAEHAAQLLVGARRR